MNEARTEQFERWVSEWRDGLTHTSDLTNFAETLVAEAGDLDAFHLSPAEIKSRIIEHVADFERDQSFSYEVSRTGGTVDMTATMKIVAGLLKAQGISTASGRNPIK